MEKSNRVEIILSSIPAIAGKMFKAGTLVIPLSRISAIYIADARCKVQTYSKREKSPIPWWKFGWFRENPNPRVKYDVHGWTWHGPEFNPYTWYSEALVLSVEGTLFFLRFESDNADLGWNDWNEAVQRIENRNANIRNVYDTLRANDVPA